MKYKINTHTTIDRDRSFTSNKILFQEAVNNKNPDIFSESVHSDVSVNKSINNSQKSILAVI